MARPNRPSTKTRIIQAVSSLVGLRPMASYEAAGNGRRAKDMWGAASVQGPVAELNVALPTLRKRSRWEVQNNPSAARAADVLVSSVVGDGIRPAIPNAELRRRWDAWVLECDADQLGDFYTVQALVWREVVAAGEALARLRPRKLSDGLTVPLQIQCLPSEMLPLTDSSVPDSAIAGIEFDGIGRPRTYWLYDRHPDEANRLGGRPQVKPVASPEIMHVYRPMRFGQLRGEPWLTRAIVPLHSIHDYTDAELVRKQTAALFGVIVTDPQPTPSAAVIDGGDPDGGAATDEQQDLPPLQAGALIQARYGTDVKVIAPADVGAQFEMFIRAQYRQIASAIGLPYDLLTGDYNPSDRVLRQILHTYMREVRPWVRILVQDFCRPVWLAFLEAAEISGAWRPSSDDERLAMQNIEWVWQPFGHVHPTQEAQADVILIGAGLKSLHQAAAERGRSFGDILEERRKEAEMLAAAGIQLTLDPRGIVASEQDPETEK